MKPLYKHELLQIAKELRKNATKQENHLWYDCLRSYPVKIQRQRPIKGFIVDFYCAGANLAIEIDGSQHYTEDGIAYDRERSAVLESLGIEVIRFSNEEVSNNFEGVCEMIDLKIKERMRR